MKLEAITQSQCEQVRLWRNAEMECWRTPFMLTKQMQDDFYEGCCNRESPHRYFAIIGTKVMDMGFLGMGGITNIQWENRIGEITLIINPAERKNGLGEKAVDLLLDHAFNYLNLQTVFGECYVCNEAHDFWKKMTCKYIYKGIREKVGSGFVVLRNRKYWQGKYYNSLYFSIDKDDFNKIHNSK